ncbi:hypothetical protein CsSME_00038164 [Camellia sinensis var. sinensis]
MILHGLISVVYLFLQIRNPHLMVAWWFHAKTILPKSFNHWPKTIVVPQH